MIKQGKNFVLCTNVLKRLSWMRGKKDETVYHGDAWTGVGGWMVEKFCERQPAPEGAAAVHTDNFGLSVLSPLRSGSFNNLSET